MKIEIPVSWDWHKQEEGEEGDEESCLDESEEDEEEIPSESRGE